MEAGYIFANLPCKIGGYFANLMSAVGIEEARQPFDAESFPFAFLEAFGNKETTLKRLARVAR